MTHYLIILKYSLSLFLSILAALSLSACTKAERSNTELLPRVNLNAASYHYKNGSWLTEDMRFVAGDRYSENGVFVEKKPEGAIIIDLAGKFMIPPFGDAHSHSVDQDGTQDTAKKFMKEGVFYYKNLTSVDDYTRPMLDYWQQADTLDISFALAGLSKDEGHPEALYKRLSSYGMYPDIAPDDFEGRVFFDVDTIEELDAKWDKILSRNPDVLKLYLLEHGTDESDGLTESAFREIVRRANEIGLRTSVHIETVPDLALAVDAGASEAAHLPAYNLKYAKDDRQADIPDDLMAKMAAQGFILQTTLLPSARREYSSEDYETIADRQINNLSRAYESGVPIVIGSDAFYETTAKEIEILRELEIFDDHALLKIWIDTPIVSIFPKRAIGQLSPGFEASFLGLDCNPVADFECSGQISVYHKQGMVLNF